MKVTHLAHIVVRAYMQDVEKELEMLPVQNFC